MGLEDVLAGSGFSSELGIIQKKCICSDYLARDEPDEQILLSLLCLSHHFWVEELNEIHKKSILSCSAR